MALPSNISLVTLTGSYSDFQGNPVAGSINFTSSATLRNMLADVIVVASTATATLDSNGSFSIVLPATNDPSLSDVFTYSVEEAFEGGRSYTVSLAGVDGADRINIVYNPSFETNINGWTGSKVTVAQSATFALVGSNSLRGTISTGTAGQYIDGNTGVNNFAVTSGLSYTASVYIYVPATNTADTAFTLQMHPYNGTSYGVPYETGAITVPRGAWKRLSVTFTPTTVNSLPVTTVLFRVLSSATLAVGQVFYIDGALLEQTSITNSYFDGSTDPRAAWSGTAHNSTSTLTTSLRYNPTINSNFSSVITNWSIVASTAAGTLSQVTGLSGIVDTNLTTALQVVSSATARTYNLISGNITSPAAFFAIGQTYTLSFYARVTSGSTTGFSAYLATSNGLDTPSPAYFAFTPTSSWQRFTYTFTATGQAASTTGWYVTLPTSAAVTAQFTGFLVEKAANVYPYISSTAQLALEISDLAPIYVVSPTYYSFVSASTWADLDATVQAMDAKVDQTNIGFISSTPATTYADFGNETYAQLLAYYGIYSNILVLGQFLVAADLTPYITQAQTQQTNAESSLATAQTSLSSILTENAARLDDFTIMGA